jgi:hypothetical protein
MNYSHSALFASGHPSTGARFYFASQAHLSPKMFDL